MEADAMKPVRTRSSNFVYRGPAPDIGDAWVERVPVERAVYLDWQPSREEREAIAGGALIRLGIHGMEPIPPVSLNVSDHPEISVAGAIWRDRAQKSYSGGPGYWAVSDDAWRLLNEDGALDGGEGVPTLLGRPLLVADLPPDTLSYQRQVAPTSAGGSSDG